jgi:hypothetical protein
MYSLQLAGFIGGVDPTYIANPTVANGPLSTNNLADSVAGKNMPFAKFSKNAAWDYLYLLGGTPVGGVGPASSTYTGSAPAEFILSVFSGNGSTTSLANTIVGNHAIILRDANIKIGSASSTTNTPGNPGLYGSYYSATSIRNLYSSDVQSGISSYLSQKLDSKFDDGMPLTGNIFAGKGGISSAAGTGSNPGDNHPEICHSAIGVTFPITTPYNKNNNTLNGCVMGFLVKNET